MPPLISASDLPDLAPCDLSAVDCECHKRMVWKSDVIQGAISYPYCVTEDHHVKAS
jgi:hypothetical protein